MGMAPAGCPKSRPPIERETATSLGTVALGSGMRGAFGQERARDLDGARRLSVTKNDNQAAQR
jgi:hypothetical protein